MIPQIIMLCMYIAALILAFMKAKRKINLYDKVSVFMIDFIGTLVGVGVLWWGGFWDVFWK